MRFSILPSLFLALITAARAQETASPALKANGQPPAAGLIQVKRIYVAPLTGGVQADALRELIIASLDATKLFVLTENPERADAVLKGAADDKTFTDAFDTESSLADKTEAGIYSGSRYSKSGGGYGSGSVADREAHHIRERKHEAYAAVRLCNSAGDVLWSTSQESKGAKFRGASNDVAAKIARQLTLDFDRARESSPAAR